jgi:hypothetical protein
MIIIVLATVLSCNKSNDKTEKTIKIKPTRQIAKNSDFGFNYSNFNVVEDTVKRGDTFGTIINRQNIGDRKVYEIVRSVKDTFNARVIRPNKLFCL